MMSLPRTSVAHPARTDLFFVAFDVSNMERSFHCHLLTSQLFCFNPIFLFHGKNHGFYTTSRHPKFLSKLHICYFFVVNSIVDMSSSDRNKKDTGNDFFPGNWLKAVIFNINLTVSNVDFYFSWPQLFSPFFVAGFSWKKIFSLVLVDFVNIKRIEKSSVNCRVFDFFMLFPWPMGFFFLPHAALERHHDSFFPRVSHFHVRLG